MLPDPRTLTPTEQDQAARLLTILSQVAGLLDQGTEPRTVTVALIDVLIRHAEQEGFIEPDRATAH